MSNLKGSSRRCRYYVRKTGRGLFSAAEINKAVDLVINEHLSSREVVKRPEFEGKFSFKTLSRYVKKRRNGVPEEKMCPQFGVSLKVFTEELEKAFIEHISCRYRNAHGMGMSSFDVRKAAYEFAKENNRRMPDSWMKNEIAGVEWLFNFRNRHPDLSFLKPRKCSLSQTSIIKRNVAAFYDNLESILQQYPELGIGTRIYSAKNITLSTVELSGIDLADEEVANTDKGTYVSGYCFVASNGTFIPPVLLFPRTNFERHLMHGAPPGSLGLANESGRMTSDQFLEVMKHFVYHTQSSEIHRSLLIYDDEESHLTAEVVDFTRSNGVMILVLPRNYSLLLQPLDASISKPFKTLFNAAIDSWIYAHHGQIVSIYEVASLFNAAFIASFTPSNIIKGFQETGIFPFNRNLFTDEFLYNFATERTDHELNQQIKHEYQISDPLSDSTNVDDMMNISLSSSSDSSSLSQICQTILTPSTSDENNSSLRFVNSEQTLEHPQVNARKTVKLEILYDDDMSEPTESDICVGEFYVINLDVGEEINKSRQSVGRVLTAKDDECYEIDFLCKCDNKFTFPRTQNTEWVSKDKILTKVPCLNSGTVTRLSNNILFDHNVLSQFPDLC